MQLTDALCYALLTITIATTCINAESELNDIEERRLDRRMNRRTATLIVESAPVERMFQKPKVIYRRISKKRHAPPRATYGPPRPKYGPPRSLRKPGKKYRSKLSQKHVRSSQKHVPAIYKKRAPKPRFGSPKRPTMKPVYGPPKISPQRPYYQPENSGFGEPPTDYSNKYRPPKIKEFLPLPHLVRPHYEDDSPSEPDMGYDFSSKPNHQPDFSSPASFTNDEPFSDDMAAKTQFNDIQAPKKSYAEPPVDSYGAPIKPNLHDLTFSTAQSFPDSTSHLDEDYNFRPDLETWKNFRDPTPDNSYAYSKKLSAFAKPDAEVFVTPAPEETNEELHLNSYSDIYNYRETKDKKKKKKKTSYFESVKMLNQPWKGGQMKGESNEEIIVGGQYAEPPARYVPKFQPSAPMHNHDDSVFSPPINFPDHNGASSATMSSYVNYKNSNMAFSPQNLNDVFSIVDK